ncbi:hypothetical protein SI859A1_01344 [Aurantimonas manganoxydans SI85-9A1]|uniref:PASTA domain-containing protein n=3 Tax=Alphaproteobacteria TaxID=28211 RepID=Q1YIX6_AURMS|nr:hypothetical protein SI859A1_01344 [Aurantimonas manganoxydans SI85-9A1]
MGIFVLPLRWSAPMIRIVAIIMLMVIIPVLARAEPVPSFQNMYLEEAQEAAGHVGIELEIEIVESSDRKGIVIKQIPGPGSELGSDRAVWLRVSNGITLPDLKGRPQEEALAALRDLGVAVDVTESRHDGGVRGTVWSQVPVGGTAIDVTTQAVFLDVVGGRYVAVPGVTGTLLSDGMNAIRSGELTPMEMPTDPSGFVSRSVQENRRDCSGFDVRTATVIGTKPPAGSEVYPGTSVQVDYAIGQGFRYDNQCGPEPLTPHDRGGCAGGARHEVC